MEFSSTVRDLVNQKHIQMLEQIQLQASGYMINSYIDHSHGCMTEMMSDLQWESLESRRQSNRLCMLYRINNNLVEINRNICLQASDRQTRGQTRVCHQRIDYLSYRNSFFPRTSWEWNALPTVMETTSLEGFRHLLSSNKPCKRKPV